MIVFKELILMIISTHSSYYSNQLQIIKGTYNLLLLLFRCSVMSNTLQPHELQHTRLPCPSPFPGVCSNSCPLSQWCHPTISSCHPLLLLPSVFPASESYLMRWLFTSCGQSIGASASGSVLPMNIQGWFPLGWTGLISLQSKGLSRVFFSTTIQKHCDPFMGHSLVMAKGLV